MADDYIEREEKIPRVAILFDLAIHTSLHADACPWVDLVRHNRPDRTESVKAFGAGPLSIFVLEIAGSDVVYAGVAEDVLANVGIGCGLVASLADHHSEFAFIVDALRNLRTPYCASRRQQGRSGLQKNQGLGGNIVAKFCRVLAVVPPDAHDLRRTHRRQ